MQIAQVDNGDQHTIEIHDDAKWLQFPSVGKVARAAGLVELPMRICICKPLRKWAVGFAQIFKQRVRIAKLTFCSGLAANLDDFNAIKS